MIRLDTPRTYDLVSRQIIFAGVGTGFEATINWRVSDGHDEIAGYVMCGGGSGEHGQFVVEVDTGGLEFALDRIFVEVFEASARDGTELHKIVRAVLYGPRIVSGYYGWRRHVVRSGDTLIKIARINYGTEDYEPLIRANPALASANEIRPGEVIRVPIGSGL